MKEVSKNFVESCKELGLDPYRTSLKDLQSAKYLISIGRLEELHFIKGEQKRTVKKKRVSITASKVATLNSDFFI